MGIDAILWLIAIVCLIGFEIATMGLYTIWFAGGSVVAFIFAWLGLGFWPQIISFLVVSGLLLFFTRPVLQKKLQIGKVATNADRLVGQKVKVIETIDNNNGTGRVIINGQEWMARAKNPQDVYEVDTFTVVREISGVKLIVEKAEG